MPRLNGGAIIMITLKRQWRTYKTGSSHEFNKNLERRLVKLGIAKYAQSSILDTDVDRKQELYDAGFETVDEALKGDLTAIEGIGKATEKKIKDELHNS